MLGIPYSTPNSGDFANGILQPQIIPKKNKLVGVLLVVLIYSRYF